MPGGIPAGAVPVRSRARELFSVPGLLTLARLPLAAAFPFVVSRPPAAVAVLAAAACTDMLDGWWARRFEQVTATGAALDPLTDKVFTITVGISLAAAGVLPVQEVLLLGTREIGEFLIVLRCALGSASRRKHAGSQSANLAGKVVTVLQFAAVVSALHGASRVHALVAVTAVAGALAALLYWKRALLPVAATGGSATPGSPGPAR